MWKENCLFGSSGSRNKVFHFAIAIKVELQSRRELCLEIRLEMLFFNMETQISFSPAFASLSLQRQERLYGC